MAAIPWNEENAAHLLRRAGFGGTAAEIQQALADGLELSVEKLLNVEAIPTTALDQRLAAMNLDLTKPVNLIAWWLTRLVYSPRQLEERMTLFLHDHFATAISKVQQTRLMLDQNNLFRRSAFGSFTDLTIEVSRDPAMLIWLDNFTSRKERPNENYGRELLELFTLGHENFTEADVIAAARAFTGWTLRRGDLTFQFVPSWHDDGSKTFLGQTGNWNGDDIVRIACAQMAHGHLIASKLFSYFAYENPEHEVVERLAMVYMENGTSLRALVRAILTAPEMYSSQALWSKVKSPADHCILAVRNLGVENDRLARTIIAAMSLEGQVLFNPPDVDGWAGALDWISAGALLTRMNFAAALMTTFDSTAYSAGQNITSVPALVDFYLRRLGPVPVSAETRQQLVGYVAPDGQLPSGTLRLVKERGLTQMILSLPEWQTY